MNVKWVEHKRIDSNIEQKGIQNKKPEKRAFDGPTICMGDLILCNIQEFWDSKNCPKCRQRTKKISVRIRGVFDRRCVYGNGVLQCENCDVFYITREKLEKLNIKAKEKYGIENYVYTANVSTQTDESGVYLFIPKTEFKSGAPYYDVRYGGLYMPSAAERARMNRIMYEDDYDDEWIPLREKSILGECGYSVNLPEARRKWILEGAVNKYGQYAVIDTIERNIRIREMQKKDYSRAIGIWRRDIEYVKTIDESEYLKRAEAEREIALEAYYAAREKERIEREKYFAEQNVFWWENRK